MRSALIGFAITSIGFAILSCYASNRAAQQKHVDDLVKLGGSFRIGKCPINHIQVWYDDQLAWSDSENRYKFNSTLSTESDLKNWVSKWLGRDYVCLPIAIEIIKFNYPDEEILDSAIIEHIRSLRSVRQITIRGFMTDNENVPREIVDEFIKTTFPNLVNASPQ